MRRAGRIFRERPTLAALSVVLFFAGSRCAGLPVRDGGDSFLFHRLAERSWISAEPARTFGPANLYEEIDGEAELFLPYAFRDLTVAILTPAGKETAEVRLELFRHATPRDAFGVYSQHRFPEQERMRLGTSEAVVSATSLDFFRGTAFVRLRTVSRHATRQDLENLGRDLSDLLPGTGDPPRETEALRIPGLVDGTMVFHRRAILGVEALAPGYEAKYAAPGVATTLILIPPEDAVPAAQFRERLSRALPGLVRVGEDLIRADLPTGTLWILSREGFHLGVAGKVPRDRAEEVLAKIARRLPQR
ncbi:MAG: DUF6599 family protein [Candidatus Deferrimicrobiaceae bacterium]